MVRRDIVVIGGSAGAIETLQRMVRGLDDQFSSAIFVVYTAAGSSGYLPRILQKATPQRAAREAHVCGPERCGEEVAGLDDRSGAVRAERKGDRDRSNDC